MDERKLDAEARLGAEVCRAVATGNDLGASAVSAAGATGADATEPIDARSDDSSDCSGARRQDRDCGRVQTPGGSGADGLAGAPGERAAPGRACTVGGDADAQPDAGSTVCAGGGVDPTRADPWRDDANRNCADGRPPQELGKPKGGPGGAIAPGPDRVGTHRVDVGGNGAETVRVARGQPTRAGGGGNAS